MAAEEAEEEEEAAEEAAEEEAAAAAAAVAWGALSLARKLTAFSASVFGQPLSTT